MKVVAVLELDGPYVRLSTSDRAKQGLIDNWDDPEWGEQQVLAEWEGWVEDCEGETLYGIAATLDSGAQLAIDALKGFGDGEVPAKYYRFALNDLDEILVVPPGWGLSSPTSSRRDPMRFWLRCEDVFGGDSIP